MTAAAAVSVKPRIRHRLFAPPLWEFPTEQAAITYANGPDSPVSRCGSWFTWEPRRRRHAHLTGWYALTAAGRVVLVWPRGGAA